MKRIKANPAAKVLLTLLFILGAGALFGGAMLIISPTGNMLGMPLWMLDNSPFSDFLVPGIILFTVLGVAPLWVARSLVLRKELHLAELFNFYKDMYWAWTYTIYIAFALIAWIQLEMVFLRAVHWSHTLYMFFAVLILFVALFPQVRALYKK